MATEDPESNHLSQLNDLENKVGWFGTSLFTGLTEDITYLYSICTKLSSVRLDLYWRMPELSLTICASIYMTI